MKRSLQVNIHDAKTNLSYLIENVAKGAEVVIAKAGKPMAKLVPMETDIPVRKPGFLKGKIRIAKDFDAPLRPEVLAVCEGRK